MRRRLLAVAGLFTFAFLRLSASAFAQGLTEPDHDAEEVRRRADEILSRGEFQEPSQNFLEKAQNWVGEKIAELIASLTGGGGGAIVAWVILGAALAIIAFLVLRFTKTMQIHPSAARTEVEIEHTKSAADWRAEAAAHEAAGAWKAALRCRYRVLIAELISRGLVRDVPGRTSGEYRGDVLASVPESSPDFAGATELFELAFYGDRPTGVEENRHFRELADHVVEGAGR